MGLVQGLSLIHISRRGILVASHVASIGEVEDLAFDPVSIPVELMKRLSGEYLSLIHI